MNPIIEQQLRRELAMTNVVVESKIKFNNNFFVKWYGKTYIGGTKADVLRQIPKIKEIKKALNNNKENTMPKLNRLFKKIQKFDVIENDKVKHLFKITHLDNSTAVYDNDGKLVMKSSINKPNNNKEKK